MENIDTIIKENNKLKEENEYLKSLLIQNGILFENRQKLMAQQQLEIFMSYFKGRTDVYASKYWDKKKNKPGYTFSCNNKFSFNCYLVTKKGKCSSECPNYNPKQLSAKIYYEHIKEDNKAIGLYPLLADNTTYLLAIDFDDEFWFEDMLSVRRIANRYKLSSVMEVSQSGNGGHLWFFFHQPIKASLVRTMGDFLIKEAMKTNKRLSFQSLDRMYPSQNYHSGAGFGGLIALPLQRDCYARQNPTTVFINEFNQVIRLPFNYLQTIKKITENDIQDLLKTSEQIEDYFDNDKFTLIDRISEELHFIEKGMLYFDKKSISPTTLLVLRRLASMKNSAFGLKLKMHQSIYGVHRILEEYLEDHYRICIPRGLKQDLLNLVSDYYIEDYRCIGKRINEISFKGELNNEQKKAVEEMLKDNMGILNAHTGFGKTVTALYLLCQLKVSTLIIVQKSELLKQWQSSIKQFIDYPQVGKRETYIGIYTGSKKNLIGNIDIATIGSLANLEDISIYDNYGLVIIDECHHASSDTYRKVLRNVSSKYVYSLTATTDRRDNLYPIVEMYLGKTLYKTNKEKTILEREYEQILIPRITTFNTLEESNNYNKIIKSLYLNQKRNYLIVKDIREQMSLNKNIIVLTDRKEHVHILYNQLKYDNYDIYLMYGNIKDKDRKQIHEKLINQSRYLIIATTQLIGEGFNLPSLNTMFITMPISYKGRLIQIVGRLHRDYIEKKQVTVFDYVDSRVHVLNNMFQKRLSTYKFEGYKL